MSSTERDHIYTVSTSTVSLTVCVVFLHCVALSGWVFTARLRHLKIWPQVSSASEQRMESSSQSLPSPPVRLSRRRRRRLPPIHLILLQLRRRPPRQHRVVLLSMWHTLIHTIPIMHKTLALRLFLQGVFITYIKLLELIFDRLSSHDIGLLDVFSTGCALVTWSF